MTRTTSHQWLPTREGDLCSLPLILTANSIEMDFQWKLPNQFPRL